MKSHLRIKKIPYHQREKTKSQSTFLDLDRNLTERFFYVNICEKKNNNMKLNDENQEDITILTVQYFESCLFEIYTWILFYVTFCHLCV